MKEVIPQSKHIITRKRPLQLWLSLAVFAVLIVGLILILQPWRTIKNVSVASTVVSKEQIKKYVNVSQKTPYWRLVGQQTFIENRLQSQSDKVDSVKVTLKDDDVLFTVVERINAGFVQQKGQWYAINQQGNRHQINQPDGDAPVYSGFKSDAVLSKTAVIFSNLEAALRQNISQIIFSPTKENPKRLKIIMADGNTVLATTTTFGQKIVYYPGIAAQMKAKGVVDLQFGAFSYNYKS
ncbi:cell division protein FtsQ/DivIB [Leuconostoc pseudomesenteroides]|uniref:cell division protein FtsQ/DivIB n=1 Tax=Leuconostoc pseudomesenteroides TaxID=33968 RepID=UPI004036A710